MRMILMNRVLFAITAVGLLFSASAAEDRTGQAGFTFGISPGQSVGFSTDQVVGFRYHFNDLYCLNPGLGFSVNSDNSDFTIVINNLFFISGLPVLEQFIEAGLGMQFNSRRNGNNTTTDTHAFLFDVGYGLQYGFNRNVAAYGILGLDMHFPDNGAPSTVASANSGIGLVFYFN
jgi:hypothetical protein